MRPSLPVWPVLLLTSLACGSGKSEKETGPSIPYNLSQRPVLPFPTDALLVPDSTRPTGFRMALDVEGRNLGDVDESLFLFGEDFTHALDNVDGWSTLGPTFMRLDEDADPASLEDHLLLVDLDAKTIVPSEKSSFGGMTKDGRPTHWVSARSPLPLRPKTHHAILIIRGLKAASGARFVRSALFDRVFRGGTPAQIEGDPARIRAAQARLGLLKGALGAIRVAEGDVLVAETFTTQSIDHQSTALLAAFRAAPVPEITIDTDPSGGPQIFRRTKDDPRWEAPRELDESSVGLLAHFSIRVPSFRAAVKGPLVFAGSQPVLQGSERVEGILTIPVGAGPFPVILFQHGLGDRKESVWRFASDFARLGTATIAFDAPLHGARSDHPHGGISDFINLADPSVVVDNFLQAESEHAYFVRAIDAIAAIDLFGDGSRRLDPARIFYVGHSLGSIIGAAAVGVEPRYQGAALMVGGGTLLEFFDRILEGTELHQFPAQLFGAVVQAALDRGDPTNYAHLSSDKQILLMQAMEDEAIPARATESLARAMALPQVEPVLARAGRVPSVASPQARRGWTQFDPATHSLGYFPASTSETYARARAQLFHFLSTWLETGVAEIR